MRRAIFMSLVLLALAACGDKPATNALQGYAEADYLYLSPRAPGYIEALNVKEGDDVNAGEPVFSLDADRAQAALNKAKASAAASGGDTGASAQAIAAAKANAELARVTLARTRVLYSHDYASKSMLDQSQSAYDAANAGVKQAQAQRGASGDLTLAASQDVKIARADANDRVVTAPASGRIEIVFRRPGEFAPAGEPVVALLPPGNIKLRFFAPEPMLAKLKLGQSVRVKCDGCAAPIEAKISFIASEPQFTPPVIYSLDERAKLVYLIEARPVNPAQGVPLRPGQPVDVGLVS